MQAPVRLLLAARLSVSPALLVGIASSTAVFAATPFLLPAVVDSYDVGVGAAGWISTTQLAGFVVASWVGGRFLKPVRRVFVTGALFGVVANLASALAPTFGLLVAARFLSGVSLGLAAWIAWQAAFGDEDKVSDVAVVGPLVGIVVSPLIASVIEWVGLDWLFVILAAIAGLPLLFARQVPTADRLRPHRTRHAATRAARAILVALMLVTLGGSSVFVYGATIARDLDGLSPLATSLVYSANAAASIPAARWTGRRGTAGVWFSVTAVCALAIGAVRSGVVFAVALMTWGFVFFMGVPAAFALLAARSRFPQERAGDAQAVMALGRVFGPMFGGALISAGSPGVLGGAAAGVMFAGALLLIYVDRDRFVVTLRESRVVTVVSRGEPSR